MTKGISKGITKENIVNTTLELIRNKESIRSVNLREIAREIGCAHTNLYNHFEDFDSILWEALDEVLVRSQSIILGSMRGVNDPKEQLECFYKSFIDFYLQNKGWFRLFWMEKLKGTRPEKNITATTKSVNKLTEILKKILNSLLKVELNSEQIMNVFHTVHAYIYGEISLFISGRGLITDESEFKNYILIQSQKLSMLMVNSEAGR